MLKNNLKMALRNLWKSKGFTAINIMGLAIGISTCLLITLYVVDELSYDKFNTKASRIYRVNVDLKFGGKEQKFAVGPAPLAFTAVKKFPQVENAVRFRSYGPSVIKKDGQNIRENRIIFADSTLFDVFTFNMINGDPKKALIAPRTIVINETTAKKYFGDDNAVGKTLRFDNTTDYTITGVVEDMPANSHFNYDFFIAMAESEESQRDIWLSFNFNTYILLREDADINQLRKAFDALPDQYIFPQAQKALNVSKEEFEKSGDNISLGLIPLTDIHLRSDRIAELSANSSMNYVYIFSAIAVFILLIACVNFMNLSTARSANRAKEVGIRKVLGSARNQLIRQFLTESVLMSIIAFAIALLLGSLLIPLFNDLSSKQLSLSIIEHPVLVPVLFCFAIVVGLLAGSYPAFYLSAFQPIKVLKGRLSTGFRNSIFRNVLVVFQFAISIALIIGTIVIYKQLNFIQDKKLGFQKEQVLVINSTYVLENKTEAFRDEVLKNPQVVSGTVTGFLPIPSSRNDSPFFPEGEIDHNKAVAMQYWSVDHEYIPTLGMELKEGRNFSKDFLTDSTGVIINETAASLFGYQKATGRKITLLADPADPSSSKTYTILGVVKNFHYESMRENIGALCMILDRSTQAISFRLKTAEVASTVASIESIWKKMAPGEAFNYTFLDEGFNAMYDVEQKMGKIFIAFAILAIFIACLGLFGLATYAASQRTKEIGIRKVLGATIPDITSMLSKDFIKLVLIAAIIIFPVAWYAMHKWLEEFAYRITISWWIFFLAAGVALLIAIITISFQAIKAAIANPVKSLRTE